MCMWKPRTVLFSVSCSDALPGLQQPPPPSCSEQRFCFLWDDYGLFPNPQDTRAGIKGMNILTKFLSPLDPQGKFAPVQEGFYHHNVVVRMKHRCVSVSHLVRREWHKSLTITGSPRKSKFWPCKKLKIPSYPASRRGLRYEVRQWHVLLLLRSCCRQSPADAVAVTLPFPQLRSVLKCYTNERIRITVRHWNFKVLC